MQSSEGPVEKTKVLRVGRYTMSALINDLPFDVAWVQLGDLKAQEVPEREAAEAETVFALTVEMVRSRPTAAVAET